MSRLGSEVRPCGTSYPRMLQPVLRDAIKAVQLMLLARVKVSFAPG